MAGATARFPMSSRILTYENYNLECPIQSPMRLADSVFEFLDDQLHDGSPESSSSSGGELVDEDDEKENKSENVEEDRSFWETQQHLLQNTLCRTSSVESRIRSATKESLKEAQLAGNYCACRNPVPGGCRSCLRRDICGRLQNAGFDSAICKTKWMSSRDIPAGEHTFLDVLDNSSSKKGGMRVIVELNFRAEFEVARASEEYNKLIKRLPEVFVGKVERLQTLIKILCSAAKKCMKENKMHMAPWRKQRYMQAKWLSNNCEKTASPSPQLSTGGISPRASRPRASLLTVDLMDNLANSGRMAVEVV